LGVCKVQSTIKKEFVANVVQAEMQHYHLYIVRHAPRATNATASYVVKHKIVNNDMV
jgi:predicted SprT family Zn-dependent metalloprotease